MPILDFKCTKCGARFEELVFSYNKDRVRCPSCKSGEVAQIYEGKCLGGGGKSRGSSCEGKSCSDCSGCSH